MTDWSPVVLEGRNVRLEPLTREHRDALAQVALDPDIWRWTLARIHTLDDLDRYLDDVIELRDKGEALPFVTIDKRSGGVVGSTRFALIDRKNRSAEIGWTWINPAFQRTAINTEAKLLMFTHAFEEMGCVRVWLRANVQNEKSRAAILRIGATFEGILRHSTIAPDGRIIDWAYYSVIRDEWPAVKRGLEDLSTVDRRPSTP